MNVGMRGGISRIARISNNANFCRLVVPGRSFHTTNVVRADLNITSLKNTRNIGIIAHIDAGKTTTTERMLFYSGVSQRIGNVDEGDTVTDYLPAERDRGITIQSAAVTIPWNNKKINIIDTPGHADFTFEVIRSLRVLDGVVTILDAVAGVEAQTEKVWKQADDLGIPKLVYVNKMDREGAGFSRTVKEVVSKLGTRVVLCNIPFFIEDPTTRERKFHGVIDVLEQKLLKWDETDPNGQKIEVIDITEEHPELYEECSKSREAAVETLGEFDETIIDSFFENEEDYMKVPASIIRDALKKASLERFAVPVLCGSSFRNIGVQPLMDAVVSFLPSPVEIGAPHIDSTGSSISGSMRRKKRNHVIAVKDAQEKEISVETDKNVGFIVNKNKNLSLALAFKVITHPNRGVMVFVRVYSGKLHSQSTFINTRTGEKVKVGKLLLMHADVPREIATLNAGNIGVITGTGDEIMTGDTLVCHALKKDGTSSFNDLEGKMTLHPINIPPPVFSTALEPRTLGDKRHMEECLKILIREDPSLKLTIDEESGQTLLAGMGELHLEIVIDRLLKDMKAKIEASKVMVTYKETLLANSPLVSKSIQGKGDDSTISIDLELAPYTEHDETLIEDDNTVVLEVDNNIVVFDKDSAPQFVRDFLDEKMGWPLSFPYEAIISAISSGASAGLQTAGPISRLPLHSTVVKIQKWSIPTTLTNASQILTVTRHAILEAVKEMDVKNFTILEPVMKVSVYVNGDDIGNVVQDLTSTRNALIDSIDEGDDSMERLAWAKEEAERIYLPKDPTLSFTKLSSGNSSKKIIRAEAPLKEMIGYLSKLRSLTQGRSVFDMEYSGMRGANKERVATILNDL